MIFCFKVIENVIYFVWLVYVSIWVDIDLGGWGFFVFFVGENWSKFLFKVDF